jgi:hypothetical protein
MTETTTHFDFDFIWNQSIIWVLDLIFRSITGSVWVVTIEQERHDDSLTLDIIGVVRSEL